MVPDGGWPYRFWPNCPDCLEGVTLLTQKEAAERILRAWLHGQDDFNASLMMMLLVCLSVPVTRSDVLSVVRAYCDSQSENHTYRKKPQ